MSDMIINQYDLRGCECDSGCGCGSGAWSDASGNGSGDKHGCGYVDGYGHGVYSETENLYKLLGMDMSLGSISARDNPTCILNYSKGVIDRYVR